MHSSNALGLLLFVATCHTVEAQDNCPTKFDGKELTGRVEDPTHPWPPACGLAEPFKGSCRNATTRVHRDDE